MPGAVAHSVRRERGVGTPDPIQPIGASPDGVPRSTLRRRLLESLAWQGGASAVGQAISWLVTLVVIRLLSPEDYGLVALAGVLFGFLSLSFDFGVGAALVQTRELAREELRSAQSLVLLLGIGAGLIVAGLSRELAWIYGKPSLVPLSAALGLLLPLIALSLIPQSIAYRELRFDLKARADLSAMLASASVTLGLAWLGAGPWALVGGIAATHLTRAIVYLAWTGGWISPSLSLEAAQKFVHFGSLLSVERFLWFLFTNVDLLIVGKILGEAVLGLYVVTLTLSSVPLEKISPLITQVAFPAFSKLQDDPALVRRSVVASIRYAALVFVPLAWGAALLAPDVLPPLLGEPWADTVRAFQCICAVLPLRAISSLVPPALQGTGRIATNVGNLAITLAVMSAAYLAGVRFGLEGVALAWLLAYPLAFALTLRRALHALEVPLREVWAACRSAVAAGAAMVAAIIALRLALAHVPVASVAACIGLGAAVYLSLVRLGEPQLIAELRAVFDPRVTSRIARDS
jgi:O-antigen/teichoic acid export membrane protein